MNYIKEINSFYDWLETNSVSDSVITLWHGLMHINNKTGWKLEFTVAISTLQVKTGLSSASIKRARNVLSQLGRIKWKQRNGNLSSVYEIIPFADHSELQNEPQTVPQSVPQTVPQSVPINKLNETKQNSILLKKESKGEIPKNENSEELSQEENSDPLNTGSEEKEKSSAKKEKEIIDHFHENCNRLPKVQIINQQRKKSINARINDYGIEKVKEVIEIAGKSNFLSGENKAAWSADFDWIMKPTNFVKVLEGNYNNKEQNNGNNQSTNNGFSNQAGNSKGSSQVSGKTSFNQILARKLAEQNTADSESGNITIDVEVVK
ncbi:hypothetical protein [Chryseobacterium lathyri]|uniref:Bacteriophage lambda Replication protein O N-terminal domain-containing protein n=1 Tax=Chryseobacterium lathyri TaxID=395933 RepID=A0A511YFX6_9FLAO|nr:hypothetical protein [Chryseobacterium lathyri]GEN74107.1 hypothetical protein CLA01_41790 [Chryseobacterium lathyri]